MEINREIFNNRNRITGLAIAGLVLLASCSTPPTKVDAADSNFSDGITVDSVLDGSDTNISDSICDDGLGNCTLRAAIEEANNTPGSNTIEFNIPGAGVRTIQPVSGLPSIIETVIIDGYSQPGSQPNTAVSPEPLNGTLLIELDGTNAGANQDAFTIDVSATNVEIRGLVINRFDFRGIGGNGGGSGLVVQGNYIGTDPTGLTDQGNGDQGLQLGPSATIGGLDPEDRNIISGNDGGGASPNVDDNNWVVQGNYIGLGADGETVIPNSTYGGTGAMSIDNSSGHVIGGSEVGATNVISGNNSFGIFPDNVDNLRIQGNIIGPDWKGDPIPGSPQLGGIGLPPINGSMASVLIGGTLPEESNLIAYNNGPGVAVMSAEQGGSILYNSTDVSILGNRIFGNTPEGSYPLSLTALGIDLLELDLDNFTLRNSDPTLNDPGDTDTGANNLINFPVINSVKQQGTNLEINFDLDTSGSTVNDEYRVELFANDTADPTNYGEGQLYLGSMNVKNGSGQTEVVNLATAVDLNGKVLSSTTTALSNSTPSGFGSTSEFSALKNIEIIPTTTSSSDKLAATGMNATAIISLASGIALASGINYYNRFIKR